MIGKLAAAAAVMLCAVPGLATAAEACKVQALEMPVVMKGSRAVATIGINGTQVPMTVDSGAFFSSLTPAAAQQLDLKVGALPMGMEIQGLNGRVDAGLAVVKEMQLLGGKLPDMEFIVGGNEIGAGTMGLLGRNILAFTDVEYDLAHGAIRLMFLKGDCSDKNMAYWAGEQAVSELPLLREDKRLKMPPITAIVELNGRRVRALFDTGATTLVSLSAAKRVGLNVADMEAAGKTAGMGLGYADSWNARFDSVQIGGEKVNNIRARVVDYDGMRETDMLLGVDFFLSHRIYISKSQRKMYFTYNGGPVFALSAEAMARSNAAAAAASAPASAVARAELDDADAYARRGAAAASRLDHAGALADLDRAIELAPQSAAYRVQRGMVHQAMHQGRLALADYEAALAIEPKQLDALMHRAWLRGGDNHARDAVLADVATLDALLPPQANDRRQLAYLLMRMDLPEGALAQLDPWIASHQKDIDLPDALNTRCWIRMLLNVELDKALADCDRAASAEPDNAPILDSRGWLRLRRGEWSKALADYDRALKIGKDRAWTYYGRGIVHMRLGHADAGRSDLAAARKLDPTIDEQTARHGLAAAD